MCSPSRLAVQAQVRAGADAYQPLVDIDGLPCWPAEPDWAQLDHGEDLRRTGRDFECHWQGQDDTRRSLQVGKDFDCVVLGVGLGAIPHLCGDILRRDARWRDMVEHIGTIATQAFQLWMAEDMESLGWRHGPGTLSGFVEPFDTWSDMQQLLWTERWPDHDLRSIAYFCNVLPTPEGIPSREVTDYPAAKRDEVRHNAITFMRRHLGQLWPGAVRDGHFRWSLLLDHEGSSAAPRAQEATLRLPVLDRQRQSFGPLCPLAAGHLQVPNLAPGQHLRQSHLGWRLDPMRPQPRLRRGRDHVRTLGGPRHLRLAATRGHHRL